MKVNQSAIDAMDDSTIRPRWDAIETKSAAVILSSSVMVSSVASVVESEVSDQDLIAMSEVFDLEQLTNFTDTQRDTVKEATEEAKKVVAAGCRLVDGTEKESLLFMALRDSAISRIQGGRDGYLVIVYDLKSSGEDPKDPFQRSAPLRKAHVDRLTGVALKARSTVAGEITPGDMWIFVSMMAVHRSCRSSKAASKCARRPSNFCMSFTRRTA